MRYRRGCRGWWIVPLAFGLDRVTKLWVQQTPAIRDLIPGVLRCHPVDNPGIAFSMLSGQSWLLPLLTGLVLAGLTAWLVAKPDEATLTRTGFWLIVGGGLGNLFDRLAYGAVIDFLEVTFTRFAIFNVADVCVCVGAGLAALGIFLSER